METTSLGIPIPDADPENRAPQLRLMVEGINALFRTRIISSDDFDLVGDDSTDNSQGFLNLRAHLIANPGTTVVFTPGTYRYKQPSWLTGIKRVRIIGNGAKFRNTNNRSSDFYSCLAMYIPGGGAIFGEGTTNTDVATLESGGIGAFTDLTATVTKRINTANPLTTTVTLQNIGDAASFSTGQRVFIGGYDQQGSGFPPNYRYFEYNEVIAINGGTGVLTLKIPLRYYYDQRWLGLPAAIIPLSRNALCERADDIYIENIELLENPNLADTSYFQAENIERLHFKNVVSKYGTFSGCGTVLMEDCTIYYDLEPDKEVCRFQADNCFFYRLRSATGVLEAVLNRCEIGYVLFPGPRRVIYNECRILGDSGGFFVGKLHHQYPDQGPLGVESIIHNNPQVTWHGGNDSRWMLGANYSVPKHSLTVLSVPSATTITASNATYELVAGLTFGAVLWTDSGKRAVVRNVYRLGTEGTNNVTVEAEFETAPIIGDVYKYNQMKSLILNNAQHLNVDSKQGQHRFGEQYADYYYNNVEHALGRTEVAWDINSFRDQTYIVPLNGYVERVQVFILRAYTGASGTAGLGMYVSDLGLTMNINYKIAGYREINLLGTIGLQSGDSVPANMLLSTSGLLRHWVSGFSFFGAGTVATPDEAAQGFIRITYTARQ